MQRSDSEILAMQIRPLSSHYSASMHAYYIVDDHQSYAWCLVNEEWIEVRSTPKDLESLEDIHERILLNS